VYASALHELGRTAYPGAMPTPPRWWPKRWRIAFDGATAGLCDLAEPDE
jgi:hypothetical protein